MFGSQIAHPLFVYEIGRARQAELLKEADRDRIIQLARAGSPSLMDRCLAGIGDLLVAIGARLQGAHAPA